MFGEMPTFTFNGAVTGPTLPENGVATLIVLTDSVFSTLSFRWPIASPTSVAITGVTIPAGTILYGVSVYVVTSGAGIAYHSSF